jgi:osmoprotectant transport system permease protein
MKLLAALLIASLTLAPALAAATTVHIGSKKFTESVVLAAIAARLVHRAGDKAALKTQLGGTAILWQALTTGQIDIYPEYTGTIARVILHRPHLTSLPALRRALAKFGVRIGPPLGFNNTYALGMPKKLAAHLGIRTISDLRRYPNLAFGFSNEFLARADGWPGLKRAYNLPQTNVRGLDHALAYRALAAGTIQMTDLYSTDAEIDYYHLRVLKDDKHFFPQYKAVYLYRAALAQKAPTVVRQIEHFKNKISVTAMRHMNNRAKIKRVPARQVAASFMGAAAPTAPGLWGRLAIRTGQHLYLVAVSLGAAILVAVPLGILAARVGWLSQFILGAVGIAQTIPSLALLVFMIPLLGIGGAPALAALFLYSLLPIVRNTHSGLTGIAPDIRDSALALGLPQHARLLRIELPLALPEILAGIKISAVINIGTATLGALIGAGGYGQPILTGIRLDDLGLILEGAVPAALLALVVQGAFELAERWLVSPALRTKTRR